jgi:hypothetical protein
MMQRFVRRSFNQLRRSSWHGMVVLLCDEKLRVPILAIESLNTHDTHSLRNRFLIWFSFSGRLLYRTGCSNEAGRPKLTFEKAFPQPKEYPYCTSVLP